MNQSLEDYIRRHDGVIFAENHHHPDNPAVYRAVFAAAHGADITQSVIELPPRQKPSLVQEFSHVAELASLGLSPNAVMQMVPPLLHSSQAHVLQAFAYGMDVLCVDVGNRNREDTIYMITSRIAHDSRATTAIQLMMAISANQQMYIGEFGEMPSLDSIIDVLERYQPDQNIHKVVEQRRLESDPLIANEIVRQTQGKQFVGVFGANHAAAVKYPSHVNVTKSLRGKGLNIGLVAVSADLPGGCMKPDFVLKVG